MRDRLGPFIARRGDELLAAVVTLLVLLEVGSSQEPLGVKLAEGAAAFAIGLAVARRIRFPLVLLGLMLGITALAVAQQRAEGGSSLFFVLLLAVYNAAAHTNGRETAVAGAMAMGLFGIDLVGILGGITGENLIFGALLYGAPWIAGRAVRGRRLREVELEREKATAAAAIVGERARIARELHDVVAHSISVIVLQARGGRSALESQPDDSRDAFVNIERTGQEALTEMRRLLGMLRASDEAPALAPQPGLRELEGLVDEVRATGVPVHLTVEGEPRELPPGVDLSAYRIVQEALTNALRHAGPSPVRVIVRYTAQDLELEVDDDGAGSGDGSGAGYGLIGMRERVSVYGGELHAGRRPDGGYALRVRLPLGSVGA